MIDAVKKFKCVYMRPRTRAAKVQGDDCVSSSWGQQGEGLWLFLQLVIQASQRLGLYRLSEQFDHIQLWALLLILWQGWRHVGLAALNHSLFFLLHWLHILDLLQRQDLFLLLDATVTELCSHKIEFTEYFAMALKITTKHCL